MSLGPTELLIILIAAVPFVVALIGGIDAARKPANQWQRAGESQMLWVLGQLLGAFFCGVVGLAFAIIYFASIRQKVMAAG
jgi:hypothetical protein